MHNHIDILVSIDGLDKVILEDINSSIYRSQYFIHIIKAGRYIHAIKDLTENDILKIDRAII